MRMGAPFRWLGRQALHVGYVYHIAQGAGMVRDNWKRLASRPCPNCGDGRLHAFSEPIEGQLKHFRGCEQCDYFEAVKPEKDPDSLARLRDIAQRRIDEMGGVDRQQAKFKRMSRVMYAMGAAAVLAAIAFLFLPAFGLFFLNLAFIGLFMLVQGMAASYRFWQLDQRQLYVSGAFKVWLRSGAWII